MALPHGKAELTGGDAIHLVQILLPAPKSSPHADETLAALRRTLVAKFGGVTAYTRAPARGEWLNDRERERDDIVIVEVMVDALEPDWWKGLRLGLEKDLEQREIVIRSQIMERL